ncbi:MAG: hypothetical protein DWI64_03330 [Chloroflexi bacterium]|nr:MAG: hypothetical protein DWI64_03330 [Chloroflexota bacterium]
MGWLIAIQRCGGVIVQRAQQPVPAGSRQQILCSGACKVPLKHRHAILPLANILKIKHEFC